MNTNYTAKDVKRFVAKFTFGNKDQCWEWQASKHKFGYGWFGYKNKVITAHTFSYLYFKGDPGDLEVCHSCDNPACINPNHLWLGTHIENMQDKVQKGRHPKGEKAYQAKLTNDQAKEIRAKYATGNFYKQDLAKMYHVRADTIRGIITGEYYA